MNAGSYAYDGTSPLDRAGSAVLALAIPVLVGAGLLLGFARPVPPHNAERLSVVNLEVPLPPPPPDPPPAVQPAPVKAPLPSPVPAAAAEPRSAAKGAPAPQGETAPQRPAPVLPPLVTAPSGSGSFGTGQGAGVAGMGSGAGGVGSGTGAGGAGGDGGGGGGSDAEFLSGRIASSDYPSDLGDAGAKGIVVMRLSITAEGRVGACSVAQTSGFPALDSTACRLAQQRFRFRPATNAAGRAIADTVEWEQHFTISGK